ncbi:RNA-directed DNA polymerase, eukaryota, reverse transcriptase zinc-binding domain protein [Tanacetum coccineum]
MTSTFGKMVTILGYNKIGIAVDSSVVHEAANKIGCMATKLPFPYLGINIGDCMSRIKAWDNVIEKVLCRLSKWKMKSLSIGGRLTLLKSVLGSTPLYYMSMYKVPIQVLNKLESIRYHFFNGVEHNVRKMSFVKWKNVLAIKRKGGLMCSRVSMDVVSGRKPCFSSNWYDINQIIPSLQKQGIDLLDYMQRKLGNGEHTRFWEDPWKGGVPLKILFPRIFSLEMDKSISVASKLADSSGCTSLRRIPRGGIEHAQMEELHSFLDNTILSDMQDRWRWTLSGDGEFSVSTLRGLIDDKTIASVGSKTRWNNFVPSKINILAWRIKHDFLPTRYNISRRGIDLVSIACASCTLAETTSHIFFTCSLANHLYLKIARWWNVTITDMTSYEDWYAWFSALRFESKIKKIFEGVFYITWWLLWNFRNNSIFSSTFQPKARLFDDILAFSFPWCKSRSEATFLPLAGAGCLRLNLSHTPWKRVLGPLTRERRY